MTSELLRRSVPIEPLISLKDFAWLTEVDTQFALGALE